MKKTYTEIKSTQPVLFECFFAFSNEQLAEGLKKCNLKKEDIRSGGMGLYGTPVGITKLFADYDAIDKEIAETCEPQEVYDYEFGNHECSYTRDDSEAYDIVVSIYGEEKSKEVKRRFKHID